MKGYDDIYKIYLHLPCPKFLFVSYNLISTAFLHRPAPAIWIGTQRFALGDNLSFLWWRSSSLLQTGLGLLCEENWDQIIIRDKEALNKCTNNEYWTWLILSSLQLSQLITMYNTNHHQNQKYVHIFFNVSRNLP